MAWTKDQLAAEVERLGPGEELERFAAGHMTTERELLQEALLERSDAAEYALRERIDAKGWLRRQWDKADPR
jgi:flagellar biosynthesis regulator FlaF